MLKAIVLIAAGISLILAIYCWLMGQKNEAIFVGLWVPSILALGCFLKKN